MTLTRSPTRTTDRIDDEAQLLFEEARRRRRRRWLKTGIALIATALIGTGIASTLASTAVKRGRPKPPQPLPPQVVGLPTGTVQSLESAGPLAVNATGSLFVVDEVRHEVLVRLTNGQFRVVAGDGTSGFSGDGGPAVRAALSDVSDLAFGPTGDLYVADGGRVRVIDQQGIIETLVGNGGSSSPIVTGTPAQAASLGPVGSIAISPAGVLYLSTSSQLLLLRSNDQLQTVTAIGSTVDTSGLGSAPAPIDSFGTIAVDSQGNVYASSVDIGWSVYKITPDGTATHIGAARGSGGTLADVQLGPGGTAYAGAGSDVVRAEGDQLVPFHIFDLRAGRQFFYMQYFAFSPSGVLYADNVGESAFSRYQRIVSLDNGKTTELWRRRVRDG